ncbi:MAG: DSD1 family PLP-dependent enzyme [Planctomycetaceae bacterium]|nr:DSD1 family PLP-dependent enzyme [Planctomycetaceae bacterium]
MAGMKAVVSSAEPVSPGDPRIGQPIEWLDSPSLLLDRAASDRNLQRMAQFFQSRSAQLRPHFKNHKCVTLAKRQLAAGAVGMTCAKLSEAEVLVAHGFDDVLIANQVVGERKLRRLAGLARQARIAVAVDHPQQVAALTEVAAEADATIYVLVEVDIGMGRCGVAPGKSTLELGQLVMQAPQLKFDGLQAFEGHLVNVLDRQERSVRARTDMQRAVDTRRLLEEAGLPVARISGCSTSTYDVTGVMDGVDEVQAGSYATMDCQYQRLTPEFDVALSVLTRVISRPSPDRAVLDVGVKGAGGEFGVPQIRGFPEVEIPFFLSEEHLVVRNVPDWKIADTLQMIPSHSCTTCNLYREMIVHENGVVVDVWPIEASGRLS